MAVRSNLSGHVFNRLKVLNYVGTDGNAYLEKDSK